MASEHLEKLRAYAQHWRAGQDYLLWGAGSFGKSFYEKFKDDINICGCIDSDPAKAGTHAGGLHVITASEFLATPASMPIIITSGFYDDIKPQLEKLGLREDYDFTSGTTFTAVFRLYNNSKISCSSFRVSITPRCTLQCRDCNMQMPRFTDKMHFALPELQEEVDSYFRWVDEVHQLALLGGEPFLHPELETLLDYIGRNYRERIAALEVMTNGTILPSERFWKLCSEHKISLQISDYSCVLPHLRAKVEAFKLKADQQHVPYRVLKYDNWLDFGLKEPLNESEQELQNKFQQCNHNWRSVYKNRYYYCHLEVSALRAGLYPMHEGDSFDLQQDVAAGREEFIAYELKRSPLSFLSYCSVCNGCGSINNKFVPAARQ